MHWRVPLGALLALLSGLSSPVWGEVKEIKVDISGSLVTLKCPEENSRWECGRKKDSSDPFTFDWKKAEEGQKCSCHNGRNSIYLKVKACEDCVELGLELMAGIVVCDLLVTLGVLCMVYFFCKNCTATFRGGAGGGGTHRQSPGQKANRPPPVPNPDYEPIRKGQREVYAGLGPRAL